MATGDQPASAGPENIVATPAAPTVGGPEPSRIPLPPIIVKPPEAPTPPPPGLQRKVRLLEGALVALLLVFAFLTASFRASNTDLFLHLATGRLIAGGAYEFGADPFTFTADGGKWINHSWLVDLVAFCLYRQGEIGGILLVILKALLVVLLAGLMLATGALPGRRRWIPVACTLLAVLVASPRLHLQPVILSFLLLAATLFLLVRVGTKSTWIWLLPVLCLLWVNVDEWFLLGPATIALYLLGEVIQQRQAGKEQSAADRAHASPRVLGLVLVGSLAACFLNPYHVQAFLLPAAIDPILSASGLARAAQFRGLFLSPFERLYFLPQTGLSVAGLAYFPLLLLGVLSFALTFAPTRKEQTGVGWRWWRVLIWLAFALLSGWNARLIPFFAVVAGPITALNFLDLAQRRWGVELPLSRPGRRWAVAGRALTVIAVLVLGAAGVLGLLQIQPPSGSRSQSRRVGWGVVVDPALRQAALQVADWHKDGLLSGHEHWFNTSPEIVNCFAWFCADEKGKPLVRGFIDQRVGLFHGAAEDFLTVRRSLGGEDLPDNLPPGVEPPPPAWRKVLAGRRVQFLAFHASDLAPFGSTLQRLYANPDEWQPCYLKGRTALFAWRDPTTSGAPLFDSRLGVDFDALAFGPEAVRAPDRRAPEVEDLPWWRGWLRPEGPQTVAAGTALQHNWRFVALTRRYTTTNVRTIRSVLASALVGTGGGQGGPVVNGTLLLVRFHRPASMASPLGGRAAPSLDAFLVDRLNKFLAAQDSGPPASLYVALRAARQAVHDNPEDARSWLVLAEVYRRLSQLTRERSWEGPLPQTRMIRQSQIAGALYSVLALNPPPEMARVAHILLMEIFLIPGYREMHIQHMRETLRLSKALGNIPKVPAKRFPEQLKSMESAVATNERELAARRDRYQLNAANKPLLARVQIAQELGLPETALNLLLKADTAELEDKRNPRGVSGAMIAVNLLLGLGRLTEARQMLYLGAVPGQPIDKQAYGIHALGMPAYLWAEVQLAAASGDYEAADKAMGECIEVNWRNQRADLVMAGLDLFPPKLETLPGWWRGLAMKSGFANQTLHKQADLWTLRAWLALEQGRTDRAERYARKALEMSQVGEWTLLFPSRGLAGLCLDLVARGRK
jgi:tetratricopeptide (TPR) repeat protein